MPSPQKDKENQGRHVIKDCHNHGRSKCNLKHCTYIQKHANKGKPVSYTHLTLPTSDLV